MKKFVAEPLDSLYLPCALSSASRGVHKKGKKGYELKIGTNSKTDCANQSTAESTEKAP